LRGGAGRRGAARGGRPPAGAPTQPGRDSVGHCSKACASVFLFEACRWQERLTAYDEDPGEILSPIVGVFDDAKNPVVPFPDAVQPIPLDLAAFVFQVGPGAVRRSRCLDAWRCALAYRGSSRR
jgi:hypothetical protein